MKKLISGMLALVMVLCIMSVSVMAAEHILDGSFEGYASDFTAPKSTVCSTENFGVPSNTSMAIETTIVKSGSQSMKLIAETANAATYTLNSNKFDTAATTYKVSLDVNPTVLYDNYVADTARVRIGFVGGKDSSNAAYPGATTDWGTVTVGGNAATYAATQTTYVELDIPTNTWTKIELEITPTKALTASYFQFVVRGNKRSGDRNTAIGDTVMYLDNLSVAEKTAAPAPTEYAVTINTVEGATTSVAAATTEGAAVDYTVVPQFGYYIAGITVGGNAFTGFDAYKGGTYSTGAVSADTAIVVTVASFASNDKGVSTDVATLPSAFAADDTAVTFGKVLDTTDATSWGIELKKDGVGVTPANGGSYLYKANLTNANGQYAIEFVGLEAGEYQIRSYIYVNGTATFGAPSTFVVE